MGMFSEAATESTIGVIVREIKADLERSRDKPDECRALRRIGRFALKQFEWSTPRWADEYSRIFDEENDKR